MGRTDILSTRQEIQEYLGGIGKRAFYSLYKEGLPVKKIGGRWFSRRESIDSWFKNQFRPW